MNKGELVDAVASSSGLSRADAAKAVDATLDAIQGTLANGGSVSLVGFGTFSVKARAARMGRNPRTGEAMQIITADGNVTASADPDSPVIGHLDVGTAVWSLEQRDHAHRIYLPAAQSEGWLAADNVTAESAQIVQRGREQLQELVPADAATELQAVFDRMETALAFPVATDSEQKLALLAASLEEIDSASQSRSLLLGVLFAEVLRTRSHQLRPVLTDVENEEMFPAILRTYGHHHPVTAAFRFSRARIAKAVKGSDEGLQVTPSKRKEPRVPFGQVVERQMLLPGEVLVSPNGRHTAKVRADGSLVSADAAGSIHQVGAAVEGAPSCNGWTYWHFRREGRRVPIDVLRQQIRAELQA